MSLPVPIKDIKDEPALGQSLREIVRRAADATQYQKLIGPIEIAKTLTVNGLLRSYDILANNLSALGAVVTNNLDVVGSATVERLGVAARATMGELEVYGPAFFNGAVSFSTALASMIISRLEVRAGLIVGGLASISSAVINQLSVLGQADIGNLDVRGTTTTERAAVADRLTAGTLEVYGSANFNTKPVIAGLTANRVVQTDSAGAIAAPAALTNGQILIGSTGAAPVAAAITGTANQITVATGAGSTTLSTPQDIATSSSPTFSDLTLSSHVANRIVVTGAGGAIDDAAALTNGQILIGSTGAAPVAAALTGTTNQITVTNGAGSVTLATPQNIDTGASPTFSDLTLSSHVANRIVVTGTGGAIDDAAALTNGQLLIGSTSAAPVAAALTGTANQVTVTNGAGSITLAAPQDIATASSPTFLALTLTNLNVATRAIFGGLTSISSAVINQLSVLGQADVGNMDVRGTLGADRLVTSRLFLNGNEITGKLPTVQTFTSGSGTYTAPSLTAWLRIRMVGGGGGGGGGGTSATATAGNAGGNTTFGTSLLTANGGNGGRITDAGSAAGGTATVAGRAVSIAAIQGSGGTGWMALAAQYNSGGSGGTSPFGGAGGGFPNNAGTAAVANSGSGGGGGGSTNTAGLHYGASGGGSGGYVEAIIINPNATYSYAIGAGGTAGAAGTDGYAGAAGGSGYIIVEEHYL